MKKRDMAINAGVATVFIAFLLNLPEQGYLQFVDIRPIAEPHLAKIVSANTQDCLTTPSQTKPIPMDRALQLEGKTTRQVLGELGSYFCQGKVGAINYVKFATDTGKTLYVQIDKSLDEPIKYGFDAPTEGDSTAQTKAGGSAPARSVQVPRKSRSEGKAFEKR